MDDCVLRCGGKYVRASTSIRRSLPEFSGHQYADDLRLSVFRAGISGSVFGPAPTGGRRVSQRCVPGCSASTSSSPTLSTLSGTAAARPRAPTARFHGTAAARFRAPKLRGSTADAATLLESGEPLPAGWFQHWPTTGLVGPCCLDLYDPNQVKRFSVAA